MLVLTVISTPLASRKDSIFAESVSICQVIFASRSEKEKAPKFGRHLNLKVFIGALPLSSVSHYLDPPICAARQMNREGQIDEDAHKLDEDGVQPVGHLVLQAPTNRNSARNVE